MRVLLVHLPHPRRSYLSRFSLPEPLAQMVLAPALSASSDVRIVDLRVTPNLARELGGWEPDVALVGVSPLSYGAADRVLRDLRSIHARLRILLFADAEYGNAHVQERPLDFAHPLADAVAQPIFLAVLRRVVAEAVCAWKEGRPLAGVAGLWIQSSPGHWSPTPAIPDRVGDIGVPDRVLLGSARGRYRFGGIGRMAHLFYTFGCRHKCRFCPMSKHDGSMVARSLDEVTAELEAMREPNVFLSDFEPFLAPDAMQRLADEIESRSIRKRWFMLTRSDTALAEEPLLERWKGLGLRWLFLGLDGWSPERLRELRKANTLERNEEAVRRMLALGLGVSVGFVVRSDFTREDFAELRAYVRRLKAPLVSFTVETPLVGTKLFDENEGRLTTRDWSLYDLEHAVLPTTMPLDAFYRELGRLHFTAGMRTLPAMLRHAPLRDVVRTFAGGAGALATVVRAARDHERRDSGVPPRSVRRHAAAHA
jgi:magnesium-protoporphyrin IX monomethyl ester (oxidative) cyclase